MEKMETWPGWMPSGCWMGNHKTMAAAPHWSENRGRFQVCQDEESRVTRVTCQKKCPKGPKGKAIKIISMIYENACERRYQPHHYQI